METKTQAIRIKVGSQDSVMIIQTIHKCLLPK